MQQDAIAIEAMRQGDRERYGELVDRYERLVYGIAWSRIGNRALCEDAVQETFVQGFRCLGALRRPERFAAWISRIARNIAKRIERRERAQLARLRRWHLEQETPADHESGCDSPSDPPVQETLGEPTGDGPSKQPLSTAELKAFALFLGRRFIVLDAALRRFGMVLYLPPVRNSLVPSFLFPIARFNGSSTVTITLDGDCRARLSSRDRMLLHADTPEAASRPSSLEERVAGAVRASLYRFRAGDETAAARTLQVEEEVDVFIRPPHTLLAWRVSFGLAIVGAIIALVLYCSMHFAGRL